MKYDNKTSMHTTVELEKMSKMLSLFEALAVRLKSADVSIGKGKVLLNATVLPANNAIINIDDQGNVIFCNHCAESIFGFSANNVIGKPITSIIPKGKIPYESLI